MSISMRCPSCGVRLKVGEAAIGKRKPCPGCGTPVLITGDDGAPQRDAGRPGAAQNAPTAQPPRPQSKVEPPPPADPPRPAPRKRMGLRTIAIGSAVLAVVIGTAIAVSSFRTKPGEEGAGLSGQGADNPNGLPVNARDAETGSGQHKNYRDLAAAMSHYYLLDGTQVAGNPSSAALDQLLTRAASDAEIQRAASQFRDDVTALERNEQATQQSSEEFRLRAQATLEAIRRGDYTRREESFERDDSGTIVRRIDSNEEEMEQLERQYERLAAGSGSTTEMSANARWVALEASRARAWEQLLPSLSSRFSSPESNTPLVNIEYLANTQNDRFGQPFRLDDMAPGRPQPPGRYVSRNLAGKDLTNVTLAVEMVHYSTWPEATVRHVYFIPRWKKGSTLELSRSFTPKEAGGDKQYRVQAFDLNGLSEASLQLEMSAGVVRMTTALWSEEARQAPSQVEISERAQAVSALLVRLAEQQILSTSAGSGLPSVLEELLRPVVSFMPADSDLAQRASKMLSDMPGARAEILERQNRGFLASFAAGKRHTGEWSGLLAGGGAGSGQIGVLFLASDPEGKRIRAEVFDPVQSTRRRLVQGFLTTERAGNVIVLEPVADGPELAVSDDVRHNTLVHSGIKTYRIRMKDGQLTGTASSKAWTPNSFDDYYAIHFTLSETPGNPQELADAQARERAAPEQPAREQPPVEQPNAAPRRGRPMPPPGRQPFPGARNR